MIAIPIVSLSVFAVAAFGAEFKAALMAYTDSATQLLALTPPDRTIHIGSGTVDVPVDEYDMNDLDGEIAWTLTACEELCDTMSGLDHGLRPVFGH